ncbi:MAG: M13 family metallopeptidase [Bdellovibrionota bacterium]
MKITHLLFCLITSIFFSSLTMAALPSSAIPERREFPVNTSLNPCQDFYKYTCSKVNESFKLREDRSSHTFAFNDSAERLLEKKKDFFKNLKKSKPSSEREEILKTYYSACMDIPNRKKAEIEEVRRVGKDLLAKIKTREDFQRQISESYLSTDSSPIDWGDTSNQDNSDNNDLYLVTSYLSLPEKSYYKNEEITKALEKVMVLFFKEVKSKTPEKSAKAVLEFEKALAEVNPTPEQFRQIVNNRNPIPHEQLLQKYPNLKFEALLKVIPNSTVIRHWMPEALAFLNTYFAGASVDELKDIYHYNSLKSYMDDSYPRYFQANFDFNKKYFGGPNKRTERQERCTRRTMEIFSKEIDAILMPRIFPNFPREKFISLAEKIRSSVIETLEENKWLSKEAKAEAILKMKSARLQLVSPENDKEWDFLPVAKYSATNPIENTKIVSKVYQEKTLRELREPTDKSRWMMSPLTVNAYYDSSYNKFVMPIGILQYPFYDPALSDIQNAGAVGAVIGHELGHGIDDQGSRYDSVGKQRQWMTMTDMKNFAERTKPLIAQFDAIGHNGGLTQGENIGDLVGLTAANRLASKDSEFQKNPEMQKELFLSYARVWCDVSRPKHDETQLKTDPHSLAFARVNEQVKQQPGFAKAFQCKEGDPMVLPKDKLVKIW